MTIAETIYEAVYGEVPSYENISIDDIPEEYLYDYTCYYTENDDGTITVLTYDNTSVGTSEAYVEKTISFTPTKIVCYTDAYIDTIYMILCDYYGEVAHSGDSDQAEAKLWELVTAMTSSVQSGLESKYGLTVPDSVTILGTSQEDLVNYCGSLDDDDKVIVFMSEYNIRSTNSSTWWDTNETIEEETDGNVQFIYLLSNSPAMVLSTIEMMGMVIGFDNTEAMMTSILAEIYVMQEAIDEMGVTYTFYAETTSGSAVGSDTLMGGIFNSILKMENIYDGSLMGSSMSDEQIVLAEPDVIGFYTTDSRSMDELMRVSS